VAGPGTGKSRTLIERMFILLEEDQSREVFFLTFTRTSRKDIECRLKNRFGESILGQPQDSFPRVSTLHTYAKGIVHKYASIINRKSKFSILTKDKGEQAILLRELVQDLGIDVNIELLSKVISCYCCTYNLPHDCPVSVTDCQSIINHFNRLLAFYNTFDMEGIVCAASDILANISEDIPYHFLQIDEYQDLNPADQRLVDLIAVNPKTEVVVVADDAQSIYGFRYANYQKVQELWTSTDWKQIPLIHCHRLPPHILNAALDLIANEGYVGSNIKSDPPDDKKIVTLQCTVSDLQVKAIVKNIRQLIESSNNNSDNYDEPLTFNSFLILCPSATFVNLTVNQLQNLYGIPAHSPISTIIPEDYWIVLLLLRILHSGDPLAFRQVLPILGIGQHEISQWRLAAMKLNNDLYSYCSTLDDSRITVFYDCISNVQSASDIEALKSSFVSLQDLLGQQGDLFEQLLSLLDKDPGSIPSFGELVQLIYEKFGVIEPETEIPDENKVLVTTLHSAKGLEADYVFCPWMMERFMPMPGKDLSEEKRVLYVALTRAKRDVIFTFHELYDASNRRRVYEGAMSPFLHEIRKHLRINRIRSADLYGV